MKETKIIQSNITKEIKNLKNHKKKIIFTNGCFDLVHPGHIHYLKKAKTFGDILIVAINSDKSIKKLKGINRPIISWKDRAEIIAALESVDYVIKMDEDTPKNLIKKIKPHIHVKGGDYKRKELPEYQTVVNLGGKVKIIPVLKGYSTSNIISKINRVKK